MQEGIQSCCTMEAWLDGCRTSIFWDAKLDEPLDEHLELRRGHGERSMDLFRRSETVKHLSNMFSNKV